MPIPASPITPFVFERVDRHAERMAFVDGDTGLGLTHAEVREGARRMAGGLQARGFGPGGVLAIMAPNIPEYAVAFHAAVTAGGSVTMLDPGYKTGEVRRQLADAGATWLVTVPEALDTARAAADGLAVERISVVDGSGHEAFEALLDHDPIGQVPVDPAESVAALPYSCGVGGLPKGVMLTHRCLTSNLAQLEAVFPIDDEEVTVAVLPFFHVYGLEVILNGVLRCGRTAVTTTRFRFEQFLELIERHRATRIYVVPPIVLGLAMHPAVDRFDLSSLRQVMCGGAPLAAEVAMHASDRIGCEVVQGYGLTEAGPVTHSTPVGRDRPGSSGLALPGTETRVVDPDSGVDVPSGDVGELWVRGPQVMTGYRNDPDSTRAVLDDDGWLRTGDLGRIDEDGYLHVEGRHKPIIKTKGLQVCPAELEAVLQSHPGVAAARVGSEPDMLAGERPVAYVMPAQGSSVTGPDLEHFVAERVAAHKRLRRVELVESLAEQVP